MAYYGLHSGTHSKGQTMATYKGLSGVIKVVTTGGTLAAVGEIKSFSLEASADVIEDTALGDTSKTFLAGLKGFTISLEAHYDSANAAQEDLIEGSTVDFELDPEGAVNLKQKLTGSGIVTRCRMTNGGSTDVVAFACEIQGSGALTRGAISGL